jgi:hypothetical protein
MGHNVTSSAALASILQAVGAVSLLHPEIDLNPIIIAGAQPVVVDALFVLKSLPGPIP